MQNSGGLTHPEIVPIFWGSGWASGGYLSGNSTVGKFVGLIQDLVNGPYLGALAQYGANGMDVGPARMAPTVAVFTATTPSARCNDGTSCSNATCKDGSTCGVRDLRTTINTLIGQKLVPAPSSFADILYAVMVPPGYTTFDLSGIATCDGTCGSANNGASYHFLFANAGYNGLSHEIVESIAMNTSIQNCTVPQNPDQETDIIADICACYVGGSYLGPVEPYWSKSDSMCVIPDSWSTIWQYNGTPDNWTLIGGPSRHAVAGPSGLIATDPNNNLQIYNGTPGSWSVISPPSSQFQASGFPGSMFAVGLGGRSTILALSGDTSTVLQFTGIPGVWVPISNQGASSVEAGKFEFATGYNGEPFVFSGIPFVWSAIGGPGDEFLVNGTEIAALLLDHSAVLLNSSGTANGWTVSGGAAKELFVGSNTGLAATDVSGNIWYVEGSGTNWVQNGSPRSMFALGADNTLYGLAADQQTVLQSSNVGVKNPTWNQIGGSATRLIGHGTSLYATQGITYNP